jgi:nicotinamide phosphoribosyltransferase
MFKINPLYLTDGYKIGHKRMLAPGTTKLYGTWIPRSVKHAPEGTTRIVSFGQQMVWRYIHDIFEENFFMKRNGDNRDSALQFTKDMALYLGMEYNGKHFEELWNLGYLPLKIKALPEGISTLPNVPHMTFINTVDGFAWLTLYMETIVSNLAWKASTAATIAKLYRNCAEEWVQKTDPANMWLVDYMCHDFSARGLSGVQDMISVSLGHATCFKGSDSVIAIPAARYYYDEPENESIINSVNASEHSVSTTKIFTVGEQQMIADWLQEFPTGILSIVADTFDLWKLVTEYLPANKEAIMARDGKLVIRPDSGDPVDIICGAPYKWLGTKKEEKWAESKGVIELLWDIFGGTVNEQGFKILDPHIGAIYGDSITPTRQREIYQRLAAKRFAATNIVLGVGSFTYEYLTRDTLGFAAKGSWFEVAGLNPDYKTYAWKHSYNIYKDPVTDDGTKKSLKGMCMVSNELNFETNKMEYVVRQECLPIYIERGSMPLNHEEDIYDTLRTIYENGKFLNQINFKDVRTNLNNLK